MVDIKLSRVAVPTKDHGIRFSSVAHDIGCGIADSLALPACCRLLYPPKQPIFGRFSWRTDLQYIPKIRVVLYLRMLAQDATGVGADSHQLYTTGAIHSEHRRWSM